MSSAPSVMYAPDDGGEEKPPLFGEVVTVTAGNPGSGEPPGYVNHAAVAYYEGRFFSLWSRAEDGGGHEGQWVRAARSDDGLAWGRARDVLRPEKGHYLIARGLWEREGELLALVADCTGEAAETRVQALLACPLEEKGCRWGFGPPRQVARETLNNYPPLPLPGGE